MKAELIETRYRDALGETRRVSRETIARIRKALAPLPPPRARETTRVVRRGERHSFDEPAELVLEGGTRERLADTGSAKGGQRRSRSRLPHDVPLGYHTVELLETGRRVSLIVAPQRCHLPEGLRVWAWAMQLYSVRSKRSWGIGDFGDLGAFARWWAEKGCGLLLLNPLHASTPVVPQQPSPYSPSTRRYLNPLYLAVDQLPGARDLRGFRTMLRTAGRLNGTDEIDRDTIFQLKMRALERLFEGFAGDADFDRFVRQEGASLQEYATFSALAEQHGGDWKRWPTRYRHPHSSDVRRFADAQASRVRFHQWVQWQADRQLARAAASIPVMQDLPIGIDPSGADAWAWQDVLARDMSVGAPPDEFNTRGQNWGLPPFVPHRLKDAGYRPFIETIRGTMRHAGGLRIDHVMGMFRLFWIPSGMEASEGAYVRSNADDLLAIIALESERAQAIVVGEDLGTVEAGAQKQLMDSGILSYRLLWFEKGDPAGYPERAMAAVTTHDLPTIAGLWTGSDLDAQKRLELNPNQAGMEEMRQRLGRMTRSRPGAPLDAVVARTHKLLARAPSVVVSATLEDAAGVERRPNMPGTVTEWPNWKQPLPVDLDALCRSPRAAAIGRALGRGRKRRQ